MKSSVTLALLIPLVGSMLLAQNESPLVPPPSPSNTTSVIFSSAELDQLLGPIALYPDPLIALMLPASTTPLDIVLAARFLRNGGNPSLVDEQPWDDSVRALAHYGDVLNWMDRNITWTRQLGEAFAGQPANVMSAIQRLRARARALGALRSTGQQIIVVEDDSILILPAQPGEIYVPYYDPTVVFAPRPGYDYSPAEYVGFSVGFATGWWLSYGFDWHTHCVVAVNHDTRERFWREHHRDWDGDHNRGHRPGGWIDADRRSPELHTWHSRVEPWSPHLSGRRPRGERPNHWSSEEGDFSHRVSQCTQGIEPVRRDHRLAPTASALFVGPTALHPVYTQPLAVPRNAPGLPQANTQRSAPGNEPRRERDHPADVGWLRRRPTDSVGRFVAHSGQSFSSIPAPVAGFERPVRPAPVSSSGPKVPQPHYAPASPARIPQRVLPTHFSPPRYSPPPLEQNR